MSGSPRSYRTLEEFEREEIRPGFRIGFSIDDFEEGSFEAEVAFEQFEIDPADEAGDEEEDDDAEEEEDDDR